MFNSVAKYLWGSSSEAEQGNTGQRREDSVPHPNGLEHHDAVEHLDTQPAEDDWEIVGTPMELRSDKENSDDSNHRSSHHHRHLHHHNHRHHPSTSSSTTAGPSCVAGEVEVLDDAAALAQSLNLASAQKHADDSDFTDLDDKREHFAEPEPVTPLQDCALTNLDFDSNYSSDTESSPESVFSACSGRSHATYRPGSSSEAWVIAPAPCFTGSQVGELSPIASSPLENLLIEHPSMSVYLSVPPSSLPASHPFLSHRLSSGGLHDNQAETSTNDEDEEMAGRDRESTPVSAGQEDRVPREDRETDRVGRLWTPRSAVHTTPATLEQIAKVEHAAQRSQSKKSHKKNSSHRLERENKVYQTPTKSRNSRNKNIRPSGVRASRHSQRV